MTKFPRMIRLILLTGWPLLLLAGCGAGDGEAKSRAALISRVEPTPVMISPESVQVKEELKQISKETASVNSNYDAAVARSDNEILVSYKVKHSHRFRMKKIEKEVIKKLEDKYPDYTFIVSSDYKIFLEIVRLGEEYEDGTYNRKEAKKRFKEIKLLKEELT
ncbi:YhcN/YlaJ family sporulation lipoprotein [Peribacillus sp. SCS-26]|uniref:YhcN/YlaJ family sporulation lipoprotein n=1 Tax=Paraperibacillus marinus TaxID=3115295 RepID=UPI003905F30E